MAGGGSTCPAELSDEVPIWLIHFVDLGSIFFHRFLLGSGQ